MRASTGLRALAAATLLVTGCVTTRIRTNEPGARVTVDGEPVTEGRRFWSVGPPHHAEVRVVARDGREVRARIKRDFGFGTLVLGFYSAGLCWVFCWTYPSELTLYLPPPSANAWDAPAGADPWTQPPPGWTAPQPQPRGDAPDAPPAPAADPWNAPPAH